MSVLLYSSPSSEELPGAFVTQNDTRPYIPTSCSGNELSTNNPPAMRIVSPTKHRFIAAGAGFPKRSSRNNRGTLKSSELPAPQVWANVTPKDREEKSGASLDVSGLGKAIASVETPPSRPPGSQTRKPSLMINIPAKEEPEEINEGDPVPHTPLHESSGTSPASPISPLLPLRPRPPIHGNHQHWLSQSVGEDSYYLASHSLGVADGVGGWRALNPTSNAGLTARTLMHFLSFKSQQMGPHVAAVPLLRWAHRRTNEAMVNLSITGSTTVTFCMMDGNVLRVAHLGDCTLMIIRHGRVVFQTIEQQHTFNTPYQIGPTSRDNADDALYYATHVQEGDAIILASDGVLDNLFESEMLAMVSSGLSEAVRFGTFSRTLPDGRNLASAIAEDLATLAKRRSLDQIVTPFQVRANRVGLRHKGGKPDDITVVVAIVERETG